MTDASTFPINHSLRDALLLTFGLYRLSAGRRATAAGLLAARAESLGLTRVAARAKAAAAQARENVDLEQRWQAQQNAAALDTLRDRAAASAGDEGRALDTDLDRLHARIHRGLEHTADVHDGTPLGEQARSLAQAWYPAGIAPVVRAEWAEALALHRRVVAGLQADENQALVHAAGLAGTVGRFADLTERFAVLYDAKAERGRLAWVDLKAAGRDGNALYLAAVAAALDAAVDLDAAAAESLLAPVLQQQAEMRARQARRGAGAGDGGGPTEGPAEALGEDSGGATGA